MVRLIVLFFYRNHKAIKVKKSKFECIGPYKESKQSFEVGVLFYKTVVIVIFAVA